MRAKHLVCAAGVLGAGVLAALPFRQPARNTGPPSASMPHDLTLRQADVLLEASPAGDESPAVDLYAQYDGAIRPIQPAAFSGAMRPSLEDLGPPPELPIAFAPAAENPLSSNSSWQRPDAAPGWLEKQLRPRQYKLRDGDTLEELAERLLGSRSRAGEIFQANRDVLTAPDLLPVGVTIVIPPRLGADDLEPAGEH